MFKRIKKKIFNLKVKFIKLTLYFILINIKLSHLAPLKLIFELH